MPISLPNNIPHEEMHYVRGQYNIVLGQLRRENPDYHPYIGCFNPYSDRKIRDADDFDEYLRQLAISDIYKKLYNNSWKNDKKAIESLRDEILRLQRQVEQFDLEAKKNRRIIKNLIFTILILVIALYLFWRFSTY